MIEVTPQVYLIGQPEVRTQEMLDYLKVVGGERWYERVGAAIALDQVPAAEGLVEFMGRLCYRSWEPGLNKNVTKVREDREDYILNVLRSGHGSILNHAWFNFVIHGGSRVFTAEMNRHSVGTAISEQSLRYVRIDRDIPFRLPHGVLKPESIEIMREAVWAAEIFVRRIYEAEGIETAEDFATKKTITSAVRRIAPLGMATELGWSANVRALRHVIEMRTERFAEEEIRIIVDQIARKMQQACPLLFGDYDHVGIDEDADAPSEWRTEFRKV